MARVMNKIRFARVLHLSQSHVRVTRSIFLSDKRCQSTCSDISGIFPPIPTPFMNNGDIYYEKLRQNLTKWNDYDFAGYVVQGSNGEYPLLTTDERLDLVQEIKDFIPDNKLVLAGAGCESTSATIEMSNKMADNGADAVLIVTPGYYKNQMGHRALLDHYTQVADKSKVPVVLYNVPANTGVVIPVKTVVHLSSHPNIIGIKDSGGDISRIGRIIHETRDSKGFQILAGSAGFLRASYALGAVGGVCALANVLGAEVCLLDQLCREEKWSEAKYLQHRLIAPNAAITSEYGVPGLKAAMEWYGYYGGVPRAPLQPLGPDDVKRIRKTFELNGFL
uniref:4-hydroxy-2-oxoglutarate aldolase, mitochondrial n=1 Tax=Phallusia mammillata TaxID=59560 RepID=A0A6F9DFE7_9ASCI|nr:4-hydroxy-2-oxoglutarate aldolase, mitochondrial-like [Phallusia mammillata]